MKRSRFTEEQIIGMMKEQEAGMATADVAASTGSALRRSTNTRRASAGSRCRMSGG